MVVTARDPGHEKFSSLATLSFQLNTDMYIHAMRVDPNAPIQVTKYKAPEANMNATIAGKSLRTELSGCSMRMNTPSQ